MRTVVVLVAGVALLGLLVAVNEYRYGGGGSMATTAVLQMQKIHAAARTYYQSEGGRYPPSLDALVTPSAAGVPLLEGRPSAITDPWGQPFRLEVGADGDGGERVLVWTTDHSGRRLQYPFR